MKNITLEEIIEYKKGDKSAKLNMAMAYNIPYIAEKDIISATTEERILMAAELISTYNDRELLQFLQAIIRYSMVDGLVNNVSLLTLAKTIQNDIAYEYINQYDILEQGTKEEANDVINIMNNGKKVIEEDKLNFFFSEVKRIRK